MKKFLPVLIVILGLVVIVAVFWLRSDETSDVVDTSNRRGETYEVSTLVAELTHVSGVVTVVKDGGVEEEAGEGQPVETGDRIKTGPGSEVVIEFYAGSRAVLDESAELVVEEAFIDAENQKKQKVRLELISGRIWSRVLRLLDADSMYEVEYSSIVSGVRGTAFLITADDTFYMIDVFDGVIDIFGNTQGSVPAGFSADVAVSRPPDNIADVLQPTQDAVRNDHWVHKQLRADKEFAERAAKIRKSIGGDDSEDEISAIGNEAGILTLDQPGVEHSNFMYVQIVQPNQRFAITQGEKLPLEAFAVFVDETGENQRNVTKLATWSVSDPLRALVNNGIVELIGDGGKENIVVVSRWNDGTHEHSGSVIIKIE